MKLDRAVNEQALEAIAPAGIEAAVQAAEASILADQDKRRALELALQRARYEVHWARRQYDAVDRKTGLWPANSKRAGTRRDERQQASRAGCTNSMRSPPD